MIPADGNPRNHRIVDIFPSAGCFVVVVCTITISIIVIMLDAWRGTSVS
jgi:hypothetical protein